MKPIAAQVEERVVPFAFAAPERRLASPLIKLEGVAAGYGAAPPVLAGVSLSIDNDDRIALLGANGNGKSTFAKLLSGRLVPQAGSMTGAGRVTVGFFAQHQLDELDPLMTPYDYVVKKLPDATEAQRRTRLGTIGFGADKADTKCGNLSGGEKARLLLALTAFDGPHLLILDEPTNHLDVDSREALIHALNEYEGAVILISHDRHLVDATADRLWLVADGTVRPYDGDMTSYRAELLAERGARVNRTRTTEGEGAAEPRTSRADQRRQSAERRAGLAPLKKAMDGAERMVEKLTAELSALDTKLGDAALYTRDPAAAQKAQLERGQVAKRLAEAEDAWLTASEAYEQAAADTAQPA
jgi:ATP-binding cassette subfamily F protein 3